MKPASNRHASGFTIVETMIFLVVSSALLVAAVGSFGNRIQRTQFTQAVQAEATKLKTTVNEVSTGTYPNTPPFDCTNPFGTGPFFDDVVNGSQGTRTDCVFVGKIINFTAATGKCNGPTIAESTCEYPEIYTVAGRRESDKATHRVSTEIKNNNGNGVTPRIVTDQNLDLTTKTHLGYGTRVTGLYINDAAQTPISALAIFQTLGGTYASGKLSSGAQNVNFWALQTVSPNAPKSLYDTALALITESNLIGPNPGNGILLCLQSGNNDQTASIIISASGGAINTTTKIGDPKC